MLDLDKYGLSIYLSKNNLLPLLSDKLDRKESQVYAFFWGADYENFSQQEHTIKKPIANIIFKYPIRKHIFLFFHIMLRYYYAMYVRTDNELNW